MVVGAFIVGIGFESVVAGVIGLAAIALLWAGMPVIGIAFAAVVWGFASFLGWAMREE